MAIRFFLGINICKKEAIIQSIFEQCGHGPVTQFITPKDHTHTQIAVQWTEISNTP